MLQREGRGLRSARNDVLLAGRVIFRAHKPQYGYLPHIDSVRHRERRNDYEVACLPPSLVQYNKVKRVRSSRLRETLRH